jgi:cytochrome c553
MCKEEKDQSEYYKRSSSTTGFYRHCKDCHHKIVNKNYKDNSEKYLSQKREYHRANTHVLTRSSMKYYNKNPEKLLAHNELKKAIKDGFIVRRYNCEVCGSEGRGSKSKIHAHHDDYSKPLDVVWLCAKCHKMVHMGRLDINERLRRG